MFAWVIAGSLVVGAPALKDPPRPDATSLVGEWVIQSRIVAGNLKNPIEGSTMTFTADGAATLKGGPSVAGTYTTDRSADPAAVDIMPPAGTGTPGLTGSFRIEGDTLTLCLVQGGPRPTGFESPVGSRVLLFTLQRAKKKD